MPDVSRTGPGDLTISVAAGKGGTGKTLVSTSLAVALNERYPGKIRFLDGDVEEPNANLLFPTAFNKNEVVTILVPEVDLEECIRCGKCAEVCQASAIAKVRDAVITFHELCTGCGACAYACPVDAITEVPRRVGEVRHGTAGDGIDFFQGRSEIAQQHTGSITSALKKHISDDTLTIIDAPPGTSCPMQETIEDTDYCILVTEPTPFGFSDLVAAVDTCRTLSVPCGVVINREGIGTQDVQEYCAEEQIPVLLTIPFERAIAEAYSHGQTLTLAQPEWKPQFCEMLDAILQEVK